MTSSSLLYAVVLGADRPLGLPLIADFEKKGYIVIASVATAEAVDALEHKSHGYVRALVLDPADVRVPYSSFHLSRIQFTYVYSLVLFPYFFVPCPRRYHTGSQSMLAEILMHLCLPSHTYTQ
jgi:hypothetical protein